MCSPGHSPWAPSLSFICFTDTSLQEPATTKGMEEQKTGGTVCDAPWTTVSFPVFLQNKSMDWSHYNKCFEFRANKSPSTHKSFASLFQILVMASPTHGGICKILRRIYISPIFSPYLSLCILNISYGHYLSSPPSLSLPLQHSLVLLLNKLWIATKCFSLLPILWTFPNSWISTSRFLTHLTNLPRAFIIMERIHG